MTMNSRQAEAYWQRLEGAGFIESGQHSEFKDGLHGFKADYEAVAPIGSTLFEDGMKLQADYIADTNNYDRLPDVLVGVAHGGNPMAMKIAEMLDDDVRGIQTAKDRDDRSKIVLPSYSEGRLLAVRPMFALVIDDIGTTGSTTAQVVELCRELFIPRVEVLYLLQRSASLPHLLSLDVRYRAVIRRVMDDYTPEQCQEYGPCADSVPLVHHPSRVVTT